MEYSAGARIFDILVGCLVVKVKLRSLLLRLLNRLKRQNLRFQRILVTPLRRGVLHRRVRSVRLLAVSLLLVVIVRPLRRRSGNRGRRIVSCTLMRCVLVMRSMRNIYRRSIRAGSGGLYGIMYGYLFLFALDLWFLWRKLKGILVGKFGEAQRGSVSYIFGRVSMIRRLRQPAPRVKYGEYPKF